MNKLSIGLLCLVFDVLLVLYALQAMRTDSGYASTPAGIVALVLGAVLGFVGLLLILKSRQRR